MTNKEIILTPEGVMKLENELIHLKTVRRREVAQRIKQALAFGDPVRILNMMKQRMNRPL